MSEKKPINVLAEYLTDWIHRNTDEAAPFDSFEGACGKRIEQKDVERWIFNCNYLYYRFGNYLFDDVVFCPADSRDRKADRLLDFLNANFKTIKDSNPLNLRSKQDQAVITEFLKDWPPLVKSSRNKLGKLEKALSAFCREFSDDEEDVEDIADVFLSEMRSESEFYAGFAHGDEQARAPMIRGCKELVPLWCAKDINPLYTLLIWEDEAAISQLSTALKDSFTRCGYPSSEGEYHYESYIRNVAHAQTAYVDALMDSDTELDLSLLPIPEIYKILESEDFSLSRECSSSVIPSWLLGKSQLIWNIVGCAIFGPKEIVGIIEPEQTSERPHSSFYHNGIDEAHEGMAGEVILRRLYRNRGPELAGRLVIEDVQQDCLWRVIGGYYDENAALPPSAFRLRYEDLRGAFIATQGYDESGNVTEGEGDSRYHAEISVRVDEDGRRWLILTDLGSKNGTHVVRNGDDSVRYYVLRNEGHLDVDDWVSSHDVDPSSAEVVDELVLMRGDLVHLCGSCFEVL